MVTRVIYSFSKFHLKAKYIKIKTGKNKAATYTSTSITNSQTIKTQLTSNTDNLVTRAFIIRLI
jgi:hypothetical protein